MQIFSVQNKRIAAVAVFYLQCLATKIVINEPVDNILTDSVSIAACRKEMWSMLEPNRDTERCCQCRSHNDPHGNAGTQKQWIQCDLYLNWLHVGCAVRFDVTQLTADLSAVTGNVITVKSRT